MVTLETVLPEVGRTDLIVILNVQMSCLGAKGLRLILLTVGDDSLRFRVIPRVRLGMELLHLDHLLNDVKIFDRHPCSLWRAWSPPPRIIHDWLQHEQDEETDDKSPGHASEGVD